MSFHNLTFYSCFILVKPGDRFLCPRFFLPAARAGINDRILLEWWLTREDYFHSSVSQKNEKNQRLKTGRGHLRKEEWKYV